VLGGPISYEVLSQLRYVEFDKMHSSIMDDPAVLNKIIQKVANAFDAYAYAVGSQNVMLELQFNRLPAQDVVNRAIIEFARRNGLTNQLVVTADSHYPTQELWKHREMYKKLGYLNSGEYGPDSLPKSIDDLKAELFVKNAEDVWNEYQKSKTTNSFYAADDCDQLVCDAIERTHDIAHQVINDITFDKSYKYPTNVTPKDKTPIQHLVDLCKKGMKERGLDTKPEYIARLKHELSVIKKMENADYFITLAKALELARGVCLLGVARGSSGGSLVAYVLKITDLDPIKYDCRFDRFLNLHRCLDPETRVLKADGNTIALKDISIGDEVITQDGSSKKVTFFAKSEHNRLYKIKVNGTIFTCSENHEWIVVGPEGNPIRKLAKDLTVNDMLYASYYVNY
jgi:DNA polymerase III alpha subunit